MPAVALTDQSNMFGMVKFYKAAMGAGIKPIIGAEVWISRGQVDDAPTRLIMLCKDKKGYLNLSRLVSRSYTEGQHRGIAIVQRDWMTGMTEGLIALSGGHEGDVGRALLAGNQQDAQRLLDDWRTLFNDDYFLQLTRTGRAHEEDYLHAAVDLAMEHNVPVVATNGVVFIKAEDFEAHEVRVCINEGRSLDDPRRVKRYSEQQFLRSPEEMIELFADIPEAITNTVEIAKRCNIDVTLGKYFLPDFPVPEGMTIDEYFRVASWKGLEDRLSFLFDRNAPDFADKRKPYDERLQIELDVICNMGFPGYFLIVADFIQWSKRNGIPVGPGRGSGAGSLVAYALTITDLDPLAYDLLFERFLNPERVSMPDFDVDFCMEGRDRVIDYVAQHYGRDKVSQIITYGSMAAKAVVRDVGRALGHPYGMVDKIAKLIPFELGITLSKALEQEPLLQERYDSDEDVKILIDLALKLEGITRNAGKHAGGVVIAPTELTDFAPLYCEEGGGGLVTQFDKDDVEGVGLVKFDFLGLRTLTIIDWALKTVNARREKQGQEPIRIEAIPLNDSKTFDLLKACQTTAVFQLESRGMKDLIKRLQPDNFEDIVALVALFRPGPLGSGMVDDYINVKHKRKAAEYPHPKLEEVLEPTYGVILYQEQVMQIAQILAGYTLGGADMLRRAMGKKKPEEMAKQRQIFLEGALKNGVEEANANQIFDLMEYFSGYGFNKSHSAAYALVSYQTAWLKAYYPAEFMAAVTSSDMDNTDKVVNFIEESMAMKLTILPPDINLSQYKFTVPEDKTIRYGLGALKGVGEAAIEVIIAEREANGAFKDLFEFCRRVDLRKVNKRTLETLIRGGAMDGMGPNRASLMASLPKALQLADQAGRSSAMGQNDMFGFAAATTTQEQGTFDVVDEWRLRERLDHEREVLGFYLSGHPLDECEAEIRRLASVRIGKLTADKKRPVTLAGLVVAVRTMKNKRGQTMVFATLDDKTGRIEVGVFRNPEELLPLLVKDTIVIVKGEASHDEYSGGLRVGVNEVIPLDQARENAVRKLVIRLEAQQAGNGFVQQLAQTLGPYQQGRCPVYIDYIRPDGRGRLALSDGWRVRPAEELIEQLRKLAGKDCIELEY